MAIKLEPSELRDVADKLLREMEQANSLASQIESDIAQGTADWEGAAKASYVSDFVPIKKTLNTDLPNLINDLATRIRNVADQMEIADQALAGH